MSKSLFAAQEPSGSPYSGTLQINVTSSVGFFPVSGATVSISDSDTPDQVIEQLTTDESGQTRPVELPAPNLAWSLEPSQPRPYTDYNIEVTAPGYEPVRIVGSELLPDEISLQNVSMKPLEVSGTDAEEDINIPCTANTLPRFRKPRSRPTRRPGKSF